MPDQFAAYYRQWCKEQGIQPSESAIKRLHDSNHCPQHEPCNYCRKGAMA